MKEKKNQLPPPEVIEVVRKVLELLETIKGKLPKEAIAAMGILASMIGYGKKLKEALNEQELRVVMDQLARVEHELGKIDLAASAMPSDLVQSVKALIRGLILVLRQSGAPYAYPAYTPPSGFGDPTYHYPFASLPAVPYTPKQASEPKPEPKKQREGTPLPMQTSRLVESARLTEAVEGAEGLEWQIVLIEAGLSKNRKLYSSQVLQGALTLFEGLSSYADHPSKADLAKGVDRSIRDLAGWVTNVQFDSGAGGQNQGAVVGIYHALASGPIAPLLREAWERGKPDLVQFSILGDGRQRMTRSENGQLYFNVESIERLFSLDAVPQGAAGGRVQALIASVQQEVTELKLLEDMTLDELAVLRPDLAGAVVSDQDLAPPIRAAALVGGDGESSGAPAPGSPAPAAPGLSALTEEVRRMQIELAMANRQRILMERVAASPLPDPVKDRLRDDFAGAIFEEAHLDAAIKRETEIWTNILREKPQVLTVRDTKSDRYTDALYGLLIGSDVNGVARFHSLHQAYCAVKGLPFDTSRTAVADGLIREGIGFDPGSLLIESPSITWTLVFGTALQRKLVKDYQIPAFDEWHSVVSELGTLEDFKEQKIERVGYYGLLPTVGKGATYQPLTSPGEEEAKYEPIKKGGLEDWTWEDALNDDLGALKKIPKRLALSAKITLYQYIFNFLRDGNITATTYDGVNLFHATHANMGTAALSSAALTAAKIAMRSQSALGSVATFLAVRPKLLVVPNELEALSIQLKNSDYEVPAVGTATSTQVANPHKGTFDIVVVDYYTAPATWFLVGDPSLVPTIEAGFLGGKSEPELLTMAENVGSAFTADKIVFKARFVFGAVVLDHRGLYAADPGW